MRRKCLGFLALVFVLVVSMFSNVFASSIGKGWTCIGSYNNHYEIGDQLGSYLDEMWLNTQNDQSTYVEFESNFEVHSGDVLELSLYTLFDGDENYYDQAASACTAIIYDENGNSILNVNYELRGYMSEYRETETTVITDESEGKLTAYIFLEGTGTKYVNASIESLYLKINGKYV